MKFLPCASHVIHFPSTVCTWARKPEQAGAGSQQGSGGRFPEAGSAVGRAPWSRAVVLVGRGAGCPEHLP